jgi:UDP-N-acetyl-D-glucosamine dehydrogenase
MPFRPGAGVGGHCIPVDPYYLSWKAREFDFYTKFIELAAEVNGDMPHHLVGLVRQALGRQGKAVRGARILVLGVAFKRDIDDARNSPAERLIELLWAEGAEVSYHDPYVPHFHVGPDVFHRTQAVMDSVPLTEEAIRQSDCVVIVSGHKVLDYAWVVQHAPLVIDAPNAAGAVREGREKVWRVGAPPGT